MVVGFFSTAVLAAPPGYKRCPKNSDHTDLAKNRCGGTPAKSCYFKRNGSGGLNYDITCASGKNLTFTHIPKARPARMR